MIEVRPRAALRDRVASIELVRSDGGARTVLPAAGAVLGFQFSGRVHAGDRPLSPAGVTGIQPTARRYGYDGDTASLLVRFTPQGAACLGVPASALAGQSLALDQLIAPARARELRGRLLEAATATARVAVVEDFLIELPFVRDPLIERAQALLVASSGQDARIAAVARSLSLSERQLERRFLDRVGISPKRFTVLRRFERAVALARTAPSLTEAALAAGYYDQAHFNREFRRFAGASPGAFLADSP